MPPDSIDLIVTIELTRAKSCTIKNGCFLNILKRGNFFYNYWNTKTLYFCSELLHNCCCVHEVGHELIVVRMLNAISEIKCYLLSLWNQAFRFQIFYQIGRA